MPKITIDQREVEVPPEATILDAARLLGIDIPTLCYLQGYEPSTSCLVCMVRIRGTDRFVPACATRVWDTMEVESETPAVHQVRRAALELLLSDHVGDCLAPCLFTCPAHMDIPTMLRQIAQEDWREAIVTIKHDIALPAVLGRVCPKPCEKGCRRAAADGAVAVCKLKQFAADADLASAAPFVPECRPATGKRVAIIGGGPTGLAAAYHLRQAGHAVSIFERRGELGGRLRTETSPDELPRDVLDAEIRALLAVGIDVHPGVTIGSGTSLDDLRSRHDAVLVACGAIDKPSIAAWGLKAAQRGIAIDKETFSTDLAGVYAAGNAIRTTGLVVRSVADGKEAAAAIDRFLSGDPASSAQKPFSSRMGRLEPDELDVFVSAAGAAPRSEGEDGHFSAAEAVEQAGRCLHCDCSGLGACRLKRYAAQYGADPGRYRGARAKFERCAQHSFVVYEPGKCINCGLCIQIASRAQEPLGLAFVGRGFDVRVGVPFNRSLEEALTRVAAECIAACPTAALSARPQAPASSLPILRT